MTYYEILEVQPNASPEVIRMAYKALVRKYHPDVYFGSKEYAEDRTKEIIQAYEILSSPQERAKYDQALQSRNCVKEQPKEEASPKNKISKPVIVSALLALLLAVAAYGPQQKAKLALSEKPAANVSSSQPADRYTECVTFTGSSRISYAEYAQSTGELLCHFYDRDDDLIFYYVPKRVWNVFSNGKNTDNFFNNAILGKYECQWISIDGNNVTQKVVDGKANQEEVIAKQKQKPPVQREPERPAPYIYDEYDVRYILNEDTYEYYLDEEYQDEVETPESTVFSYIMYRPYTAELYVVFRSSDAD